MFRSSLATVFLAAMLAAVPPAFPAQASGAVKGVPELLREAERAYLAKDYDAFRNAMVRLHELRPNNSEYMYQLVLAHALLDEKTPAFNIMLKMQRQGLAYDFNRSENSRNLRDTQLYEYLNDLMIKAGEPLGVIGEAISLGADVVLPEAITWDPRREAFLVGTVAGGRVLEVRKDGAARELLRADEGNGTWGVFDLLVDTNRNRLWLSSAATPQFSGFSPVDKGRSALFEFDLDSLELRRRYPVPVDGRPHALGNMAMAPNGDLYVADSRLPVVYVKRVDEERLKPFYAAPRMVSLRGLAISDDGASLYVADYEMGIARVDLEASEPMQLQVPETLNLGGIDGLEYWQGNLVIIQNGIKPQRVMRLSLDPSGAAVTNVAPLAVALDVFDYPNYGTVIGEEFWFFANSHWGSDGEDREPVSIVSVALEGTGNLAPPPEMQRFLEEQARRSLEGPGLEEADEPEPEQDSQSGN
jgi:sugar lactone lactonase YvrE